MTGSNKRKPRVGPLSAGEPVLLVDNKKRRYLITLDHTKEFQTHTGIIPHLDMIGNSEGVQVITTKGQKFRVFRPTMSDYVLEMPRGAQVIYPKDLAPILFMADIAPGQRVFETGIGSGAMSMAMLRMGVQITGYELREDFAANARKNVSGFLGPEILDNYDVHIRSAYEGIDPEHGPFDRMILDIPEPWQVIDHAPSALHPGGILVAYTPSILQAVKVREAVDNVRFDEVSTTEVLHRSWYVQGQAVRPDHRMVAHTAFLTRARYVGEPPHEGDNEESVR